MAACSRTACAIDNTVSEVYILTLPKFQICFLQ